MIWVRRVLGVCFALAGVETFLYAQVVVVTTVQERGVKLTAQGCSALWFILATLLLREAKIKEAGSP